MIQINKCIELESENLESFDSAVGYHVRPRPKLDDHP